METKVFSTRVAADKLGLADALAQAEYGMSFAKYCGTRLIDSVCETRSFPSLEPSAGSEAITALDGLKSFAKRPHNAEVARLSDDEIRALIGGRYA